MKLRAILMLALTPLALIAILFALAQVHSVRPATGDHPAPAAPERAPSPKGGPASSPETAALASPELALSAASRALASGDEARFRQTLLPGVAAQLTADAFSRCRALFAQAHPRPDWQRADRFAQDGHAVVRVALGEQQLGFHQLEGKWLADGLWCLKTGIR